MDGNYGLTEDAIPVVENINNKIMSMNQALDDISKKVNNFTQQGWISEAATSCKNVIDKRIVDAKKYFMEIQQYLNDLTLAIQKSLFENEPARTSSIENM